MDGKTKIHSSNRTKIVLCSSEFDTKLNLKVKEALTEAIYMQELGEYPDYDLDISLFNVEISAYYQCKESDDVVEKEIGGEG